MDKIILITGAIGIGYLIYNQPVEEEKKEVLDAVPEIVKFGSLSPEIKDAILLKLHKPKDYSGPLLAVFIISGILYVVKIGIEYWPYFNPFTKIEYKFNIFERNNLDFLNTRGRPRKDYSEEERMQRYKAIDDLNKIGIGTGYKSSFEYQAFENNPDTFMMQNPVYYAKLTGFTRLRGWEIDDMINREDVFLRNIDDLDVEIEKKPILDIIKEINKLIENILERSRIYRGNFEYIDHFIKPLTKIYLKLLEDRKSNIDQNNENYFRRLIKSLQETFKLIDIDDINKSYVIEYLFEKVVLYSKILQSSNLKNAENLKKLLLYAGRNLRKKNEELARMLMSVYAKIIDDVQNEKIEDDFYIKNIIYDIKQIIEKFPDEDDEKLADLKRFILDI